MVAIEPSGGAGLDTTAADKMKSKKVELDLRLATPAVWKDLVDCVRLGLKGEIADDSFDPLARRYAELILRDAQELHDILPPIVSSHPELLKLGLNGIDRPLLWNPAGRTLSNVLHESKPRPSLNTEARVVVLSSHILANGITLPRTVIIGEDLPVIAFNPGTDRAVPNFILYDPAQDVGHIACTLLDSLKAEKTEHQEAMKLALERLYRSQEVYSLVTPKAKLEKILARVVDSLRRMNIALSEAQWHEAAPEGSALDLFGQRCREIEPKNKQIAEARLTDLAPVIAKVRELTRPSITDAERPLQYDDRHDWAAYAHRLAEAVLICDRLGKRNEALELHRLRIKAMTVSQKCDFEGFAPIETQMKKVIAYLAADDIGNCKVALDHLILGPFIPHTPSDAGFPRPLGASDRAMLMQNIPMWSELLRLQVTLTLQRREQNSVGERQQNYQGLRESVELRFEKFRQLLAMFEAVVDELGTYGKLFTTIEGVGELRAYKGLNDPVLTEWRVGISEERPYFKILCKVAESALMLAPVLSDDLRPPLVPSERQKVYEAYRSKAAKLGLTPVILTEPISGDWLVA